MYCLTRRCPEAKFTDEKVNICPLIIWYQKDFALIEDPILLKNLHALCSYLAPDIDLEKPLSANKLAALAEQSLFHYSSSRKASSHGSAIAPLSEGKMNFVSKAEQKYLQEIASDPNTEAKFIDLGFAENLPAYKKNPGFVSRILFLYAKNTHRAACF